jgi:hypothetical protein
MSLLQRRTFGKMANRPLQSGVAGVGVDSEGNPVVDPTANVIALNEAANQRQDDLRELNNTRIDAEIRRIDSEIAHVREMATLRAEHGKELASLESSRVNAIRQVDVLAVSTAADRAQTAINTLANATTVNAENLRNALASTASAIAAQHSATVTGITERIAALEKASYEGRGKQTMTDPMLADLVLEMKKMTANGFTHAGKSQGISMAAAVGLAVLGAIGTLSGIASVIHMMAR